MMELTIIPPMPGMEKMLSTTNEPPIMPVNMGMIMFARGTQEFLNACRTIAWVRVRPLVLARSRNSDPIVSINSPLKYLVTVAMGFSDKAITGNTREVAICLKVVAAGLYRVGKIGILNVRKYCMSDANTNEGIDMHKITMSERMWSGSLFLRRAAIVPAVTRGAAK